jgi:hypothetical protein
VGKLLREVVGEVVAEEFGLFSVAVVVVVGWGGGVDYGTDQVVAAWKRARRLRRAPWVPGGRSC